MKTRHARCCCGSLKVTVSGEPSVVTACHCLECQRRSGSPFGVGAYFLVTQVTIEGASTPYGRPAQEGRSVTLHFCPTCGSTVWWKADLRPDHIGVAVGAFGDPDFPAPTRSVWEATKHPWTSFANDAVIDHFHTASGAPTPGAR